MENENNIPEHFEGYNAAIGQPFLLSYNNPQNTNNIEKRVENLENKFDQLADQNAIILETLNTSVILIKGLIHKIDEVDNKTKAFPITSLEQLNEIEDDINEENMHIYVKVIQTILGKQPIWKNIDKLISPSIILDFNFYGNHGKRCFRSYKNLNIVLSKASSDANFEAAVRKGFKLVKNRHFKHVCVQKKNKTE